ncbi:hypothetical protein [Nitratifractor salsuginis]|uniref:Nitric oxide-responding transcriptional regulator Dnr (Crp/Fnr family) n=1 Tax=Nitratifractor salsuginis (strain DSM 16511 / JCM 12458 / E9I37-1) TaxID=749222 RepID=E6WZH0_NITSE|nr:hypothetical protein [Nitratifractor salsuginis]ADV45550.1 hypothetical protein Nitsa_0279 [Nitratifractor salsuginis DSM 16511]
MIRMTKVLGILLLMMGTLGAFTIDSFPKNGTLNDVFNTNCLQMTQSQQMLKAYIMKGLNSTFDNPSQDLKRAIPAYDKRFRQIKAYFQQRLKDHPESIKAFDRAQQIWDESKKILQAPPTKEGALKLKANFNRMIPLLLQGSKPAAKGGLELLSLTGKLCRGPMKITNDYLLKIWGVDLPDYEADVENIIDDFHQHLNELKANPLNNEKTLTLLEKARKGFMFYEMMYNSKSRFIPSLLSRKADDNFKIIRAIKAEYKKELDSQKK